MRFAIKDNESGGYVTDFGVFYVRQWHNNPNYHIAFYSYQNVNHEETVGCFKTKEEASLMLDRIMQSIADRIWDL